MVLGGGPRAVRAREDTCLPLQDLQELMEHGTGGDNCSGSNVFTAARAALSYCFK